MLADGSWTGPKLTGQDMIQLFIGKSFFFSHYSKYFPKVAAYPAMVEWLENSSDVCPSGLDVWGFEKASYTWQDLIEFLDNKPVEGKEGKGKGKGKEREGKGKEKEKEKKTGDHKKKSGNKKQVKK